jgi:hypothetical protein
MADTATLLTGTLVLGALAYKAMDLVKYGVVAFGGPIGRSHTEEDQKARSRARTEAWNGIVSLVVGCVLGIGVVYGFAATQLAAHVTIGGLAMADMSTASKIVVGLGLTGLAGVLFDGKKALDDTDTASRVKLTLGAERTRQERLDQVHGYFGGPAEVIELPTAGQHRAS